MPSFQVTFSTYCIVRLKLPVNQFLYFPQGSCIPAKSSACLLQSRNQSVLPCHLLPGYRYPAIQPNPYYYFLIHKELSSLHQFLLCENYFFLNILFTFPVALGSNSSSFAKCSSALFDSLKIIISGFKKSP